MEISVIIPMYKPDYYIWECLDSLKNQTISQNEFEILIILNGEKEPYYSQINNWINENNIKNIKLLYSEKKGVSNARNLGLNIACGENICFIDDDDYIYINYLKELANGLKKYGKNGIVVTNHINFDEQTKKNIYETNYQMGLYTESNLKVRKIFSTVWGKVIPRKIINQTKFKDYSNGEDALFMLEISKNIKYIAVTENNIFYYYRMRKKSAHFKKKKISYILKNSLSLLCEYLKLFFKKEYSKKFVFIRILALIKGMFFQLKN